MEAAARAQPASAGPVYSRREPEKTALYKVMQEHLLTFEQQWSDQASGRTLPKFVTEELHKYMDCGILGRGFAHLFCKICHEHHAVAFSCKGRAVCPSCLGRRMNEGALNLTDYVLPNVPLRQFVLTMPFPLRFPLAFDGKLLGQVVRIFTDTVAGWYRKRHVERGLPPGETGAVTVIQRANSDLRLNPHLHTIFLDGVYSPDPDGKGQMFHPAKAPTQDEIETLVCRASKRILRFLQRRGVITLVTAPGHGEVSVVTDETIGEKIHSWPSCSQPPPPVHRLPALRASALPSASCSTPAPIPSPRASCAARLTPSIFTLLPRSPLTTNKADSPSANTSCARLSPTTASRSSTTKPSGSTSRSPGRTATGAAKPRGAGAGWAGQRHCLRRP